MHPHRPLKVGYALPETELRRGPEVARWTELRAMAERAEAIGFDSLWVIGRLLFPGRDDFVGFTIEETHGGWEAWSLMAALAAITSRIELGACGRVPVTGAAPIGTGLTDPVPDVPCRAGSRLSFRM